MKIAFVYPYNRSKLFKSVLEGEDPDNALYGFNHLNQNKAYMCETNDSLERLLNLVLAPLNSLFMRQINIDFKLARAILMIPQLNKADVIVSNIDGISLAICFLKKLGLVKPSLVYAVGLFYIKGRMVTDLINNQNNHFLRFYKWVLSGADHILYHAEIEKQKLQTLGLFNPATCTFLLMGSDDKYFKPEANKSETGLVVSVGKDRARDYKTLIQAASGLPQLNFIIVCRPSNIPKIKIPPNVSILTDQPYKKIKELYQKAILVVIPIKEMHRSSGQMTLTDTMQAAKPLIITRVVGIEHYNLQNRQNCILVNPQNPTELKNSIQDLIKNTAFRTKIKNNLKKLAKSYNTKNYASELSKVIDWVVDPVKLVPIQKNDLEFIRNIRNSNRQYFLSSDLISKEQQISWYKNYKLKNNDFMFVLKSDDIRIGMGAIYDINYELKSAEIGRFAIDNSLRNIGLGEILLKKIEYLGFEKLGLNTLNLEVFENNLPAISLYKISGFIVAGKKKVKGKDIILMKKVYAKTRTI